jgi:uncharacterized 2Fe-2S/4Fe-4S cluster protein (DUF4445 family)
MDALTPPTPAEKFLRGNFRLSCQAKILDDQADIEFSLARRQPQILRHSIRRQIKLEPLTVHSGSGVYYQDQRIDDYSGHIYGLAVDVGTTTVVFNLVDLESGQILYTGSFENPQRFGGSDVMHRISYDGGESRGELHKAIIAGLNYEIRDMCARIRVHRRHIYEVVIVGNATMRDLFFGLDVQSIGQKPYKSITEFQMEKGERETTALNVKARDLGLQVFRGGNVYGGPLIGCHVGADVAADLLAIGMEQEEDVVMLVDVGTNTEVVVGNRHHLMAASCPAGPAFEGGQVTYGMPGYPGAIERVRIEDGKVHYQTIGNAEPQGICGSGLIDLLAELRRTGAMNELGVLSDGAHEFLFVPARGMSVSRSDISALAQAKAANYCGQWIVLRLYGVPLEKVKKLYLAGAFANYIDVESAMRIGFIPTIPQEKVVKVGNASLEGATIMLCSGPMRQSIQQLARQIEHIELETTRDFFDVFVEGCMFKPMIAQ